MTDPDCGCATPGVDLREVDFTAFVLSMGTTAMYHLGQGAPETTDRMTVNLPLARHVIDLLAMLQQKTRGNLTDDEKAFLERLLLDLRLKYVEVCKQQARVIET